MKKALLITTVSGFVPQFEMNNVKILQELGYEVHYASNFHNPHYGKDNKRLEGTGIVQHQVDFVRSPFRITDNLKAYRQLKKVLKEVKPELVHCHTPMGGVLGRLAAGNYRKTGTKVIYTAHGFHFYKGAPLVNWLLYYPVERILAHQTDVLITINEEDYQRARKFACNKVKYVYGVGISIETYQKIALEQQKLRNKFGFSDDEIIFLSVGELSKRKNHQVVIKAVAELKKKGIEVQYLIAGEGNQRKKLESLIKKLQVKENVKLLGYQQDVKELMASCDCFLFPSLQEGLPVALLEASAMGKRCIASEIRGNKELIACINGGSFASSESDYSKAIKKIIEEKQQNCT